MIGDPLGGHRSNSPLSTPARIAPRTIRGGANRGAPRQPAAADRAPLAARALPRASNRAPAGPGVGGSSDRQGECAAAVASPASDSPPKRSSPARRRNGSAPARAAPRASRSSGGRAPSRRPPASRRERSATSSMPSGRSGHRRPRGSARARSPPPREPGDADAAAALTLVVSDARIRCRCPDASAPPASLLAAVRGRVRRRATEPGRRRRTADLTVMSFNVWYGGVSIDSGQIAAAIEAADADVVGVQEPEGNLRRIAAAAGLPYVDESLHLISRYPLFAAELRRRPLRLRRGRPRRTSSRSPTCTCSAVPTGRTWSPRARRPTRCWRSSAALRLPEIEPYAETLGKLADEGVPDLHHRRLQLALRTSTGPKPRSRRATSRTRSSGPPRRRSPTPAFATPTATPTPIPPASRG